VMACTPLRIGRCIRSWTMVVQADEHWAAVGLFLSSSASSMSTIELVKGSAWTWLVMFCTSVALKFECCGCCP
jgi:hypothetical protein